MTAEIAVAELDDLPMWRPRSRASDSLTKKHAWKRIRPSGLVSS
jgi:hypothetical protein